MGIVFNVMQGNNSEVVPARLVYSDRSNQNEIFKCFRTMRKLYPLVVQERF